MEDFQIGDEVKILVGTIPMSNGCVTTKWFPNMTGKVCEYFPDIASRIYLTAGLPDNPTKIWFYRESLKRLERKYLPEELFEWYG